MRAIPKHAKNGPKLTTPARLAAFGLGLFAAEFALPPALALGRDRLLGGFTFPALVARLDDDTLNARFARADFVPSA